MTQCSRNYDYGARWAKWDKTKEYITPGSQDGSWLPVYWPPGVRPVFIYGLFDPRDGRVRYIGKTFNLGNRLSSHRGSKGDTPVERWVQRLSVDKVKPGLTILGQPKDEGWEAGETFWIQLSRSFTPDLLNVTDGGTAGEQQYASRPRNNYKNTRRGENHPHTPLTDRQVMEMRKLYSAGGTSQSELAERFGIAQTTVHKIVIGEVWKHLPVLGPPQRKIRANSKFTEDDVREIRCLYALGMTRETLLYKFGSSKTTIRSIIKWESYRDVTMDQSAPSQKTLFSMREDGLKRS